MTPEERNLIKFNTALNLRLNNPDWMRATCISYAENLLTECGITADEPAPAEPAAPDPDYRGLLRGLVRALNGDGFDPADWNAEVRFAWLAATDKTVRP